MGGLPVTASIWTQGSSFLGDAPAAFTLSNLVTPLAIDLSQVPLHPITRQTPGSGFVYPAMSHDQGGNSSAVLEWGFD